MFLQVLKAADDRGCGSTVPVFTREYRDSSTTRHDMAADFRMRLTFLRNQHFYIEIVIVIQKQSLDPLNHELEKKEKHQVTGVKGNKQL